MEEADVRNYECYLRGCYKLERFPVTSQEFTRASRTRRKAAQMSVRALDERGLKRWWLSGYSDFLRGMTEDVADALKAGREDDEDGGAGSPVLLSPKPPTRYGRAANPLPRFEPEG